MRFSASEKYEIISLVHDSTVSVRMTLSQLEIPKSTFYDWCHRYQEEGFDGLQHK